MKPVSDQTRAEDEQIRKELENVDPMKLKATIKWLLNAQQAESKAIRQTRKEKKG